MEIQQPKDSRYVKKAVFNLSYHSALSIAAKFLSVR